MRAKPSLLLGLVVIAVLFAFVLPAAPVVRPARADNNSPDMEWTLHSLPVVACGADPGKLNYVVLGMPVLEWQGLGDLVISAEFSFYRWNGQAWYLYSNPTFVSQSHQGVPAFANLWRQTTLEMNEFRLGGGYEAQAQSYTVHPGYYFFYVRVRGSLTRDYYAPSIGSNAYATYYCYFPGSTLTPQQPPVHGPLEQAQVSSPETAGQIDVTPPPQTYRNYLPLVARSLDGAATPMPQPTPTPLPTVLPPAVSQPSTTIGLGDPGFESGPNGTWDEYSSNGYGIVMSGTDRYRPRNGSWLAWLGGANNETSAITQTLTVPLTHPFLSFNALAVSGEDRCYYDRGRVLVNGYSLADLNFCKRNDSYAWTQGYFDLRVFAGQTITFSIQMENDGSLLSSLFLDDLTFESGIEPVSNNPAPEPTPLPGNIEILNPGFELGDNGAWTTYSQLGYDTLFSSADAHSGSWLAWLGGANNEVGSIEQTLFVPADRPYLTYWGWISSQETTCGGDSVSFMVGSTTVHSYGLCAQTNTGGWGQGWINLSAYAGHAYPFQVRVTTNGSLLSGFYLDDFAFSAVIPGASMVSKVGVETADPHRAPAPVEGQKTEDRVPIGPMK